MKSCAIIPQVINKDGQSVDSRLFKDLLSYTNNREETNHIYLITKNDEFNLKFKNKIKYDDSRIGYMLKRWIY